MTGRSRQKKPPKKPPPRTSPRTAALVPTKPAKSLSLEVITARAAELLDASEAFNTRRAHKSDWSRFLNWCTAHGVAALPARPETIVLYIDDHRDSHKPATITRWMASISVAHEAADFDPPTRSLLVRKALVGLRRLRGEAPAKKKALLVDDVRQLAKVLDTEELVDIRDRAIILLAFASALRRSNIAALDVRDVEFTKHGMVLTLRRSKTNQTGKLERVPVAFGDSACPVGALRRWLKVARIEKGPLFLSIQYDSLQGRIPERTIADVIKRGAQLLGMNPAKFGAHSTRSGFVTSAAAAGVEERLIAQVTRHRSLPQLREYIQDAALESGNVTKKVGL